MQEKKAVNKQEDNYANDPAGKKSDVVRAHEEAEKDIEEDPDLTPNPEPGDDLDEGELAQLDNDLR